MQILLVAALVLITAVLGYYYWMGSQKEEANVPAQYQGQYDKAGEGVGEVKSDADLKALDKSLDASVTTQMDTDLKTLDADASSF